MTPEERAEFVAQHFLGPLPITTPYALKAMIEDQITAAMREARETAIEEAARFVEAQRSERIGDIETYYAEDRRLANRIRALKSPEKDA